MKIKNDKKVSKLVKWFSKNALYTIGYGVISNLLLCTDKSKKNYSKELTKHDKYDDSLRVEFTFDKQDYIISYKELLECSIDGDYINFGNLELVRHRKREKPVDYYVSQISVPKRDSED